MTFIDDYSRFVEVYFLKLKSQVLDYFMQYQSLMECSTGKRINSIRTDNDMEYIHETFAAECRQHEIIHQTTAPFSPQQNGLAERMNRTLIERARAMENKFV